MGISTYLKDIGRGKQGARSLARAQAADLFGQILDGQASDLEVGAFCIAMRVKGETPEEMCGFLDATHARLRKVRVASGNLAIDFNGRLHTQLFRDGRALTSHQASEALLCEGGELADAPTP